MLVPTRTSLPLKRKPEAGTAFSPSPSRAKRPAPPGAIAAGPPVSEIAGAPVTQPTSMGLIAGRLAATRIGSRAVTPPPVTWTVAGAGPPAEAGWEARRAAPDAA